MATVTRNKLNSLYNHLPVGQPVTSAELAVLGISNSLSTQYVRSGWLNRLQRGVFCRPVEPLREAPSLLLLERQVAGLHIGGRSALDSHGIRQYVAQRPRLTLFGLRAATLPEWFTTPFPADYHRKTLFDETAEKLLYVSRLGEHADKPLVSEPERAWLEMLSDVGVRQSLAEVREIAESLYTLRAAVMNTLLVRCTSVKTVRLCLQLANDVTAPWAPKIDVTRLRTGSNTRWVSRTPDGLLVLPP